MNELHVPLSALPAESESPGKTEALEKSETAGAPEKPSKPSERFALRGTGERLQLVLEPTKESGEPGEFRALADLGRASDLSYKERVLGDELSVGGDRYAVPRGRGGEVIAAIAQARLAARREEVEPLVISPLCEDKGPRERAFLERALEPEEIVLLCRSTAGKLEVASSVGGPEEVTASVLVTDRRQLLFAVGRFGDVTVEALPVGEWQLESSGRVTLRSGETKLRSALGEGDIMTLIYDLLQVQGTARIFRTAQRLLGMGATGQRRALELFGLAQAKIVADAPAAIESRVQEIATLREVRAVESAAPPRTTALSPLSSVQVETLLRHPAVRASTVLESMQELLATVPLPDVDALKAHCERLSGHSPAVDVVADACTVFGLRGVTSFVSRGERALGIRSFGGASPILLLGVEHIEGKSDAHMGELELAFAIGSEIAHLRYGHTRVTSDDVWAGVFEKGKVTLGVLLAFAPALKFAGRVGRVLGSIPDAAVERVLSRTSTWAGKGRARASARSLQSGAEALLEAHRRMQLTADRAGLLLAGALAGSAEPKHVMASAVSALLKQRPETLLELHAAARLGLGNVVLRKTAEGELLYPDLALRVASLAAFYLSEDYTNLLAAATAARSS